MKKANLHPRNRHQGFYDFDVLRRESLELNAFVAKNKYGNDSVDFTNPEAVKVLNRALLKNYYGISHWDIPADFLCPPIPGRADYIHQLADLLATTNKGTIPQGDKVQILDIGVGANCIYPIIGHCEYGWNFVGSDINPLAIKSAESIVKLNATLLHGINFRLQKNKSNIFDGVIESQDFFDAVICNPPFHASLEEAQAGTRRKWNNLGKKDLKASNFGGQGAELWCEGGELAFIEQMIKESQKFKNQCRWFTTLVSKEDHLYKINQWLRRAGVKEEETLHMEQGQKKSRIKAWTFNL